jgi:hypothetical protein
VNSSNSVQKLKNMNAGLDENSSGDENELTSDEWIALPPFKDLYK